MEQKSIHGRFFGPPKDVEEVIGQNDGLHGFSINAANVFFWNDFHIWYLHINKPVADFIELGLYVSSNEKQTQIKKVRTGSSPERVAIVVRQSLTSDCVITWHVFGNHGKGH